LAQGSSTSKLPFAMHTSVKALVLVLVGSALVLASRSFDAAPRPEAARGLRGEASRGADAVPGADASGGEAADTRRLRRSRGSYGTGRPAGGSSGSNTLVIVVCVVLELSLLFYVLYVRNEGPGEGNEWYIGPQTICVFLFFFWPVIALPIDSRPSQGADAAGADAADAKAGHGGPLECVKAWTVALSADKMASGFGADMTVADSHVLVTKIHTVGLRGCQPAVAAHNAQQPSERVLVRDRITACNGVSESGASILEAVLAAGKSGQETELSVERWRAAKPVPVEPVSTEPEPQNVPEPASATCARQITIEDMSHGLGVDLWNADTHLIITGINVAGGIAAFNAGASDPVRPKDWIVGCDGALGAQGILDALQAARTAGRACTLALEGARAGGPQCGSESTRASGTVAVEA